ncbi:MAG: tyrosine-protein phosphatase [Comamonas sp.]
MQTNATHAIPDTHLKGPARHLPLAGTTNFRDLGGYQGLGGRHVRWRTLFRSDHLAHLTPESQHSLLQELGVLRSADFRGQREQTADNYAIKGLQHHSLAIEPTVVQRAFTLLQQGSKLTANDTVGLMQQTYRSFIHDNAAQFAQFFQMLLDSDAPIVFHCTAGKDRTGWAATLLLMTLGVPRDVVMRDYLLTNQYYHRPAEARAAASHIPDEVLNVLWKVQEPFLTASLDPVLQQYGSVPAYVDQVLGVDAKAQAKLAQMYLE